MGLNERTKPICNWAFLTYSYLSPKKLIFCASRRNSETPQPSRHQPVGQFAVMEEIRNYSCKSVTETQHWIEATIAFLRPYRFFFEAHVVDFFKDRLWEDVDKEWIDCLRNEPVEHLLGIPSGAIRDNWPSSLREFVHGCRSLALPREQKQLEQEVLSSMCIAPLNSVLSQGMNLKKRHEVEILAAVINSVAKTVDSHTVVDVGSGQGYLAQVLSFQYNLSVLAIDGSLHHGEVTKSRAERIKKHYAAKMRKLGSEKWSLNIPKTITCRVLSANMLKNLSSEIEEQRLRSKFSEDSCLGGFDDEMTKFTKDVAASNNNCSLVLAGLHACGDLSVTMLRAFSECSQVSALVSIGCCYNLLSEDEPENHDSECGFPMSNTVKSHGLSLGKSTRDLACQSAERWRDLKEDAGIQNFDLHAFRAAFQIVLDKYYPQIISSSPSIGRQGKVLRRQHLKNTRNFASDFQERMAESEKYILFKSFSESALCHLGLQPPDNLNLHEVWKESEPFMELVGVYWSLRAALGPVVETLLLLDRVLFLQEQGGSFNVDILPIFDPVISPRNVAIIARKI
ncbi:hypothetical protein V2J09_015321 [Rumex salicifolius]